jgi:hypothetical protein
MAMAEVLGAEVAADDVAWIRALSELIGHAVRRTIVNDRLSVLVSGVISGSFIER